MSRCGLVLCALYAAVIAAALTMSLTADGDPKGQFVLMQLPIAPQAALLHQLGADRGLGQLSWVGAYLLLGLPTFALLYFSGWLIGRGTAWTFRRR